MGTSICVINKHSLRAILKEIIPNYLERDAEVLLSFLPVEASWVSLLHRNKCKWLAGDWRKVFPETQRATILEQKGRISSVFILFSRTQQLITSTVNKTFWTLSLLIPHHLLSTARYKLGFKCVLEIRIYSHSLYSKSKYWIITNNKYLWTCHLTSSYRHFCDCFLFYQKKKCFCWS